MRLSRPLCYSFLLSVLFAGAPRINGQPVVASTLATAQKDERAPRAFSIAAADASKSLETFSAQAGTALVYVVEQVRGVRTNQVEGRFRPREALERLVANTSLVVIEDDHTGALMIKRRPPPAASEPPLSRPSSHLTPTQEQPMKTPRSSRFANWLPALFSLLTATAGAQVEQNPSTRLNSPANSANEAIVLDPFKVNVSKDNGFVAASSLAGGRIATALKDTPVAYSVLTSEFLEAFNITDITQAANWTVNSNFTPGDNTDAGFAFSPAVTGVRIRGAVSSTPTRNFFPYATTAENYNLDRIDFARGPNAVLFGAGGVGGTANAVTKQANVGKNFQEVRLQVGSFNLRRATIDANQSINDKAAIRLNALWEEGDTWRDREWSKKQGVHLAATYRPLPRLTIRAEGEYNRVERLTAAASLRDNLSGWDGKTAPLASQVLTNAQLAAAGVARTPSRFVINDAFGGNIINFQNEYRTVGAAQNNDLTLTNLINGVPIRTVGFSLRGQSLIDFDQNVPPDRFANAIAGSPFRPPSREFTQLWSGHRPSYVETGRDAALVLNYKVGENLFLEVAGDVNRVTRWGNNSQRRGLQDVFLDLSRNLPTGVTNPNFLQPYSEFFEYNTTRNENINSLRAQAVYAKETRIGKLQFSAMAGSTEQESIFRSRMEILPIVLPNAPDARAWIDASELNEYALYRRVYFNATNRDYIDYSNKTIPVVNPVTGITSNLKPVLVYDTRREDNNLRSIRKYDYLQAAGNLDLFKNRLILIGAFRRDFAKFTSNRVISPADNVPGWDGLSLKFRQAAPDDWDRLTYKPKDASGNVIGAERPADSRPRARLNGVNLALPQYANDRFRDDYDVPTLSPNINTFTVGGVINVTSSLGVYANKSKTFNLVPPLISINGSLLPPTSSEGKDAGIRYTLPNGRLSLSLGAFKSFQAGTSVFAPNNFAGNYSAIYNAPVVGDLSPTGRNVRGVREFPQSTYSTVVQESNGYELEITANLTRSWRLILNGAKTEANQRDGFKDLIAYFTAQDAISRQILADAGVLINSQNVASINPAVNNPAQIDQIKVTAAVNGWNDLQTNTIPNTTANITQQIPQSIEYTGNIATDYRFTSGPLKGLRIGGGVNYRGGQVVGYRGGDTIQNPANPTTAIDDPDVGPGTSVIAPSYYKAVASASYTFKLKQGRTLQLDLNIDNLLNRRTPIYGTSGGVSGTGTTVNVPRNGDITSPARVAVPGNFYYLAPRSFTLSAKMTF